MTITLAALHRQVRERLAEAGRPVDPDARLIVEHFTGTTRTDAISRPDAMVADAALAEIDAAVLRRVAGEPVHRILGFRDFYGLRLGLSEGTLEPRPDTETLVDAILPFVRECVARSGACRILDLGTGTGAIALALLHQVAETEAVGVDISDDALVTAAANARANGLDGRFTALRSNWFDAVSGNFDIILSNPPYIREGDIAGLDPEVREHDPLVALDGGPDGLDAYRRIAESAAEHLTEGGIVGVETGFDQRVQVAEVFAGKSFRTIGFFSDLGGNDRVILFGKA